MTQNTHQPDLHMEQMQKSNRWILHIVYDRLHFEVPVKDSLLENKRKKQITLCIIILMI